MSENTKKDVGGQAFPRALGGPDGMTLHDHFAGLAMQGILANPAYFTELQNTAVEQGKLGFPSTVYWLVASLAQDMADEMIAARGRRQKLEKA